MASELVKTRDDLEGAVFVQEGVTTALINDPRSSYRAEVIKRVRAADIDKELFAKHITLLGMHLGATYPPELLKHYYALLNESMCTEEFVAAARDAFRQKLYKSELVAYLTGHVQKQRENGPDLISRGMAEVYGAGAKHGDL